MISSQRWHCTDVVGADANLLILHTTGSRELAKGFYTAVSKLVCESATTNTVYAGFRDMLKSSGFWERYSHLQVAFRCFSAERTAPCTSG